jgi:hypothetical protein
MTGRKNSGLSANRRIVEKINGEPALRDAIVAECAEEGRPLTPNAVHAWRNLKKGVPPDRVMAVSKVLQIPPHKIRPDIFPPPEQ